MYSISVLLKPASSLCNMNCDYCFYCDEAKKRKQPSYGLMSEHTLKNVVRKTMPYAEKFISYAFQGGEPTLRGIEYFEKAVAYQQQYNKNGIKIYNSIQTNGYAIDEKWCRFFKENHFLVGISVDGTPQIHNYYRHTKTGADTYHRIEHSIELLKQFGVEYNILTVVTPLVTENIKEIYDYYKRKEWNYQQYIPCLTPLGEGNEYYEYALSAETYGHFLIELFKCWYDDFKEGTQPYIRQFENYIEMAAGYMAESCEQRGVCSMQNVVEADGSVYPCDFYALDEYYLGNFNEERLNDIYSKDNIRLFIEKSLKVSKECMQCLYYKLCRGGCQRNRDWNIDKQAYENHLCKGYQMFWGKYYGEILNIGKNL